MSVSDKEVSRISGSGSNSVDADDGMMDMMRMVGSVPELITERSMVTG